MQLSIVVPAYNEAERIGPLLDDLAEYLGSFDGACEVLVVDDGSTDATVSVAAAYAGRIPGLSIRSLPENRGKGAAVADGMLAARGALRVFLDADGATAPTEIDRLLETARMNPRAVVIGSLRVPGARVTRSQTRRRTIAGRVGNAIIRVAVLPGVRDSQRGCKLFPAPVADRVFADMATTGWAFDIDVLARARALGADIVEVPVRWHHVDGGVVRPSAYVWTLHEVWTIRRALRADGIHRSRIDARRRRAGGLSRERKPA